MLIGSSTSVLDAIGSEVRQPGERVCPSHFMMADCKKCGSRFVAMTYCEKEWCPVCGAKDSPFHRRKIAYWLPKVQQLSSFGYFVFTMPQQIRWLYRSKVLLSRLTKAMTCGDKSEHIKGALVSLGFERGLSRWHWFGDVSVGVFNPHLNVIIEGGKIKGSVLKAIRDAWSKLIGTSCRVKYKFCHTPGQMYKKLHYITRATFLDRSWDFDFSERIYGYRNMRVWGQWNGERRWAASHDCSNDNLAVSKLIGDGDGGCCPDCGGEITWSKPIDILQLMVWRNAGWISELGSGYYRLGRAGPVLARSDGRG